HLPEAMAKFNFAKQEDLFASVGYGALSAAQVMTRLLERMKKDEPVYDSVAQLQLPMTPLKERDRERDQKRRSAAKNSLGVR
ncbi:MAG: hypothetical protein OWU32_12590, partial [Firmicutes bacterium]|nr:hypothetical protein [Bacillota bacterium]